MIDEEVAGDLWLNNRRLTELADRCDYHALNFVRSRLDANHILDFHFPNLRGSRAQGWSTTGVSVETYWPTCQGSAERVQKPNSKLYRC
jgi:hypothetical protein